MNISLSQGEHFWVLPEDCNTTEGSLVPHHASDQLGLPEDLRQTVCCLSHAVQENHERARESSAAGPSPALCRVARCSESCLLTVFRKHKGIQEDEKHVQTAYFLRI